MRRFGHRGKNAFLERQERCTIGLWLMRAVAFTEEGRRWYRKDKDHWDDIEEIFGIPERDDKDRGRRPLSLSALKAEIKKVERGRQTPDPTIRRNITILARAIDLTDVEKEILGFALYASPSDTMTDFFNSMTPLALPRMSRVIAAMLKINESKVLIALDRDSTLMASGLVKLELSMEYHVSPIQVMDDLALILMDSYESEDDLMNRFFRPSPPPELTPDDFPYLRREINLLHAYLQKAVEGGVKGVNILLHGLPGIGKTQLARAISNRVSNRMYEVTVNTNEKRDRRGRLESLLLSQSFLRKRKGSVILFDEIEDLFPYEPLSFFFPTENKSCSEKDRMNRLLEENLVPTIWIGNKIRHIDPAVVRRFDIILEMKKPPRNVRENILRDRLSHLSLPVEDIRTMAGIADLTPADAEKLSKVLSVAGLGAKNNAEAAALLTEQRLLSRGSSTGKKIRPPALLEYSYDFVNASMDVTRLAEAIGKSGRGTMCLYGPSGTGKTAYARHLAKSMGHPLVAKRASDLLSMWVGETEKQMAAMFDEARDEDAILLLDEADSFLHDRRTASRSWEVTQVNEMLVQMENFDGVFICSTNLMENIDQASLRRFDFKVYFDYLTSTQRRELFLRVMSIIDAKPKELAPIWHRLDRLNNLTCGDFIVFLRQWSLLKESCGPIDILKALEKESLAKQDGHNVVIGFVG